MKSSKPISGQRPLWLDIIEGGGVCIALPFLMFPTVRPALTALCLVILCVVWVLTTTVTRSPWPLTPFNGAMLALFVMTAAGTWLSAFPDLTLSKATGLLAGFALWRFLGCAITDHRRLRWAVAGFWLLCAGMTAVGVLATDWPSKVPLLGDIFSLLPGQLLDLPESASTKHANQLGGTILIYYPLVLSTLIAVWQAGKRWLTVTGMGLATACIIVLLIFTQSRSTWIGMLVSTFALLLVWAALMSPSWKRIVLFVLAGSMVVGGVAGGLIIGPDRLVELLQEPQGMTALGSLDTLAFRQEVWRWAVVAISDFPFTGCGLGTFRQVVTLLYPLNVPLLDIAHAHNIFLQVALDIGLPGLVAYVAVLGLVMWTVWQVAQDAHYRTLALGIGGGTLALHVYGLLDALALGSKPALAFWFSVGLLSALVRLHDRDANIIEVTGENPEDTGSED